MCLRSRKDAEGQIAKDTTPRPKYTQPMFNLGDTTSSWNECGVRRVVSIVRNSAISWSAEIGMG
jgi:hypothetical protein